MLSSNMSSTASALINMTNSTINPSMLQVADTADDSSYVNAGVKVMLTVILFMGFAIYLMRNSTQQALVSRRQAEHYKETTTSNEEAATASTPLLKKDIGLNAKKTIALGDAINELSVRFDDYEHTDSSNESGVEMASIDFGVLLNPETRRNTTR